jgi:hypothetical protein
MIAKFEALRQAGSSCLAKIAVLAMKAAVVVLSDVREVACVNKI